MRHARFATVLVAFALLAFVGCGRTLTSPVAATVPVRGKVLYQGRPLTRGTVTFEPDGAGKQASGDIQPDGTFVLSTYSRDDGAVPGNHRVSVTGAGKSLPLKYASLAASKTEVEVSPGKTDYTIELK